MDGPPDTTDICFPLLMCGSWAIYFGLGRTDPPRWLRVLLAWAPMPFWLLYLVRPFHWYVPSAIGFPAAIALIVGGIAFALPMAWGLPSPKRDLKDG